MLRSVEELSGYTLQAMDGEIGEVDQFYFDDKSWTICYLVVKTGNWLLGRKVLISPAALVTSKGSLLKRKTEAIPGDVVQVWGQHVILVTGSDIITPADDLSNSEKWLSVSDQLKGHEVVSTDGTRLGELNDVVIGAEGRVVSYALGRVFAEEHLAGLH